MDLNNTVGEWCMDPYTTRQILNSELWKFVTVYLESCVIYNTLELKGKECIKTHNPLDKRVLKNLMKNVKMASQRQDIISFIPPTNYWKYFSDLWPEGEEEEKYFWNFSCRGGYYHTCCTNSSLFSEKDTYLL